MGDRGVTRMTVNVRFAGMPGWPPARAPIVSVRDASFPLDRDARDSPRSYREIDRRLHTQ
jgi:hypothetical protein